MDKHDRASLDLEDDADSLVAAALVVPYRVPFAALTRREDGASPSGPLKTYTDVNVPSTERLKTAPAAGRPPPDLVTPYSNPSEASVSGKSEPCPSRPLKSWSDVNVPSAVMRKAVPTPNAPPPCVVP
jgi:hypothetical protein